MTNAPAAFTSAGQQERGSLPAISRRETEIMIWQGREQKKAPSASGWAGRHAYRQVPPPSFCPTTDRLCSALLDSMADCGATVFKLNH